MNDRPNFNSILDEAPDHVERPPTLPVGTYACIVGQPTYDKSSKKGTPFVKFPLTIQAAGDDIDEDSLADFPDGVEGKNISVTFYTTEDAIYRLDEFHEHCGLDLAEENSRRMRNDMCVNAQILAVVKHRPDPNNAENVFVEVSRTLPV